MTEQDKPSDTPKKDAPETPDQARNKVMQDLETLKEDVSRAQGRNPEENEEAVKKRMQPLVDRFKTLRASIETQRILQKDPEITQLMNAIETLIEASDIARAINKLNLLKEKIDKPSKAPSESPNKKPADKPSVASPQLPAKKVDDIMKPEDIKREEQNREWYDIENLAQYPIIKQIAKLYIGFKRMTLLFGGVTPEEQQQLEMIETLYGELYGVTEMRDSFSQRLKPYGISVVKGTFDKTAYETIVKESLGKRGGERQKFVDMAIQEYMQKYLASFGDKVPKGRVTLQGIIDKKSPAGSLTALPSDEAPAPKKPDDKGPAKPPAPDATKPPEKAKVSEYPQAMNLLDKTVDFSFRGKEYRMHIGSDTTISVNGNDWKMAGKEGKATYASLSITKAEWTGSELRLDVLGSIVGLSDTSVSKYSGEETSKFLEFLTNPANTEKKLPKKNKDTNQEEYSGVDLVRQ